jgi:hypothetical protein
LAAVDNFPPAAGVAILQRSPAMSVKIVEGFAI